MVIYVVCHARSCVSVCVTAGAIQLTVTSSCLKPEAWCNTTSTAPSGELEGALLARCSGPASFTGADLRRKSFTPALLKHSSAVALPRRADSLCFTIVTRPVRVALCCLNYSGAACPDCSLHRWGERIGWSTPAFQPHSVK